MATSNLGYQSFYQAQLTAAISASDLTIPLDVVPTPSEGFLVIESTSSTKREIIYYTSKTSNSVVCPAGGRGYDGTTAQSHTQNSAVIMAPVAAMFSSMRDLFETTPQGWTPVSQTVSSVTYNGNRSYSLTMSADVSATLSPGMRVRTTRTVSAPTQCTSLNGTTQYYSRASASLTGMAQTDDITLMAWVKMTSYGAYGIVSRQSGTAGFDLSTESDGRIRIRGIQSAGVFRTWTSYQSIPLNKWVHVAASLDMSGNTSSTNKIFIDGVDVPAVQSQGGTPTSFTVGGDLNIGARGGTATFAGKIAQAAVFSAVLSDATIKSYYSQGLSGSETNLVSAFSFNNSINDLNTTNANNLTAQGSAVATNADSPFATDSFGTETGTTDYGIITNVATTTLTVQVPEGNTIPTSGGVSAMSYSTQKVPYGMPVAKNRWELLLGIGTAINTSGTTINTTYNPGGVNLLVPVGNWEINLDLSTDIRPNAAVITMYHGLSTSSSAFDADSRLSTVTALQQASSTSVNVVQLSRRANVSLASATSYYILLRTANAVTSMGISGGFSTTTTNSSYILAVPSDL